MRFTLPVLGALLLSGCGLGGPAYEANPPALTTVDMTTTMNFVPPEARIRAGDTVEWRNRSLMTHTVTAAPGMAADPAHVALPEGAGPFHSGDIPQGGTYRHTFTVPGTYQYVCLPHEGLGMRGSVIVAPRR